MLHFAPTDDDFQRLKPNEKDDSSGAFVTFAGRVKSPSQKKDVDHLWYEADENLAKSLFVTILDDASSLFDVDITIAIHRLGKVFVGQEAVYISVRARHRKDAFLACRFLIDELKSRLPIFKKEVLSDGTYSFEQCHHDQRSIAYDEPLLPAKKVYKNAHGFQDFSLKRVLLVGAGGLGCSVAFNLIASGLRQLMIYDADAVEVSNLGRQFAFELSDIGQNKAMKLRDFLHARFKTAYIEAHPYFLKAQDMPNLAASFDLIIDATDSASTKLLLSSLSRLKNVPLIAGSIHQDEGFIHYFPHGKTGGCGNCFQEGFAAPNGSCQESGVLPSVAMMVGAKMAHLAMQFLMENGPKDSFLKLLGLNMPEQKIALPKDPNCLVCHEKIEETKLFAPLGMTLPVTKPIKVADARSEKEQLDRPLPKELYAKTLLSEQEVPLMVVCESGRRSEYHAIKYRLRGQEAFSLTNGLQSLNQ